MLTRAERGQFAVEAEPLELRRHPCARRRARAGEAARPGDQDRDRARSAGRRGRADLRRTDRPEHALECGEVHASGHRGDRPGRAGGRRRRGARPRFGPGHRPSRRRARVRAVLSQTRTGRAPWRVPGSGCSSAPASSRRWAARSGRSRGPRVAPNSGSRSGSSRTTRSIGASRRRRRSPGGPPERSRTEGQVSGPRAGAVLLLGSLDRSRDRYVFIRGLRRGYGPGGRPDSGSDRLRRPWDELDRPGSLTPYALPATPATSAFSASPVWPWKSPT